MVDCGDHRSGARELHPRGADRGRRAASAGVRLHDVYPCRPAGTWIHRKRAGQTFVRALVREARTWNGESRIPNPESRRRASAWTAVGVPLAWGTWVTLAQAVVLFTGGR